MKLCANISFLFTEVPLLQRFDAAREAGFSAVEIGFPYEEDLQDIHRAQQKSGMKVLLINAPADDLMTGGEGLAAVPEKKHAFRGAMERCLRYADNLGVEMVNILPGRCRDPKRHGEYMDTLQSSLLYGAEQLASIGVKATFEAINTQMLPGFLIHGTDQMRELKGAVGHPNLWMQYDIYHMAVMGEDLAGTLERDAEHIGHIQFADNPGRGQPGTGALDFFQIFSTIRKSRYRGWIAAEYQPQGSTRESLTWLHDPRWKEWWD